MSVGKRPVNFHDLAAIDASQYDKRYVGCVVLTRDNKILLQQRGDGWSRYPGYLAEFGGHIEEGETPDEALVRELKEELGAVVEVSTAIKIGAITENLTHHSELIYVYFWHDMHASITGCYEGECMYYDNVDQALHHPKIMPSVRWLLSYCREKKWIS